MCVGSLPASYIQLHINRTLNVTEHPLLFSLLLSFLCFYHRRKLVSAKIRCLLHTFNGFYFLQNFGHKKSHNRFVCDATAHSISGVQNATKLQKEDN